VPLRQWIKSASYAIEGLMHAARTQRHLRYHFYAAAGVLLLAFSLGLSRTEFLILALAAMAVLLAELLNTAVEATVDLVARGHDPRAKVAKDVAAAAVLVTAFGAAVVGVVVLGPYLGEVFGRGLRLAKQAGQDIAVLALVLVLIVVLLLKAPFRRGHALMGGMPSGHAALAFSVWLAITYITENFFASALSFLLAVVVAQSRVSTRVHRPLEVLAGAALGATMTFLLFKLFQ